MTEQPLEVPEADFIDQAIPVEIDDEDGGPQTVPDRSEADPADAWDQAQSVPETDDDRLEVYEDDDDEDLFVIDVEGDGRE